MKGQKLFDIFRTRSRTSIKFRSYFPSYERIMPAATHPQSPIVVELGVLDGGSLEMWQEYFGKSAKVIGIDLNPQAKQNVGDDFNVFIADQHDLGAMVSVFEEIGPVDYLIDDGAHTNLSVFHTLCLAYAYVKPGGVLVVEDLHTSFERSFGNPHKTSAFSIISNLAESMAGSLRQSRQVHGFSFWEPLIARISSIEFHSGIAAIQFSDGASIGDHGDHLENHPPRNVVSDLVDQRSLDDEPLLMRWQHFDKLRHHLRGILPILKPALRNFLAIRLWARYRAMNRPITRAITGSKTTKRDVGDLMSHTSNSAVSQRDAQREL